MERDKGAHFYKCDFQVHTPRDPNWSGQQCKSDESRLDFARKLIAACRKNGLNAIAISDHHDLVVFPFVRRAAKEELDDLGQPLPEERQIIVFPAIELTLGLPCQALIIFDANLPSEFISTIPTALGVTTTGPTESKIQSIRKIDHLKDLSSVYETINKNDSLRGRFIVLPNVTDNGHRTLLRSGFDSHYRDMPCVGGYLDGSIETLGEGTQKIIAGKDRNYGFKSIAVIQTSDSRSEDFAALGQHATWIKWAAPTAEALRQACLAKESRIYQQEPTLPQIQITALHVSNSKFMGPIDLLFSPQYTALIGGRGTGKSTILEYIRWGLCDQPPKITDDTSDLPDYHRRRTSLIEKTLTELNSTVDVHFCLSDVPHVVRRSAKGDVYLKIGDKEFRPSSEDEIRGIFPIHAYSQKQLSNVGVRIDELSRFIRQPVQRDLDEIASEVNRIGTVIKRTYEAKVASDQAAVERAHLETETVSIVEQIKTLRESLKGLSEADQELLARQARYEQENSSVELWKSEINGVEEGVSSALSAFDSIPTPPEETASEFLQQTYQTLKSSVETAKTAITLALQQFNSGIKDTVLKGFENWEAQRDSHAEKCAEVHGRSQANQTTLGQITTLEQRLKQIQAQIAERTSRIKKYESEQRLFDESVTSYFGLLSKKNELLRKQCEHLTGLSMGHIRAELKEAGSSEGAVALLKELSKGTQIRAAKLDSLFDKISRTTKPLDTWRTILFDIEKLARLQVKEGEKPKLPSTASLDEHDFSDAEKQKLAAKLNTSGWVDLLLSPLESIPVFKYRSREQEYIDFNDASAGQQATALMHVLLNQTGPPLLIDQPEDDLDSNVIEQICSEVWIAKGRRQLVFTSHNANLVVNGDAELVVSCDYRIAGDQSGGKISKQGAIDIEDVRKEITKVMEGGEKAFGLRRQKYGF